MPLVESLNGFYYGQGISNLYRLMTILLITIYFVLYKKEIPENTVNFLFFITVFLGLTIIQYLFFHNTQEIFIKDLKSLVRILLCPFYFLFFNETILCGDLEKRDLKRMIYVFSFVFSILIVGLYVLGIGYVSYDIQTNELTSLVSDTRGVGFKGFFIELNSLIAILCACLLFIKNEIINFIRRKEKCLFQIIIYVLLLVSLIVTGTKFGLVFLVICSLIFIIQVFRCFLRIKLKVLFLFSMILFLIILKFLLGNVFFSIFQRLTFFINKNNATLLNVLFSNRINYFFQMLENIDFSKFNIFINVFGKGYNYSFLEFKRSIVEIDFFDLYFSYGIIGISSYFYFFKESLCNLFLLKRDTIKNMIMILYMYSFLGGHIIFNAMSATFLAICLSYLTTINRTIRG